MKTNSHFSSPVSWHRMMTFHLDASHFHRKKTLDKRINEYTTLISLNESDTCPPNLLNRMAYPHCINVDFEKLFLPVLEKWKVPFSAKKQTIYQANTQDFGVEIKKLLVAAKQGLTRLHNGKQIPNETIVWNKSVKTFEDIAAHLGIELEFTHLFHYPRDLWFRLPTGEMKRIIQAREIHNFGIVDRALWKKLYFNESGYTQINHEFFQGTGGRAYYRAQYEGLSEDMKRFPEAKPFQFHTEGGNVCTLSLDGDVCALIGKDHIQEACTYSYALTMKDSSSTFLGVNEMKRSLTSHDIYRYAEELYVQNFLMLDSKSGYLNFGQKDTVTTVFNAILSPNQDFKEGNHLFRKTAVDLGLLNPFTWNADRTRACEEGILKYAFHKRVTPTRLAKEFKVKDLSGISQLAYHLDAFIKSGPHQSVFVVNFKMTVGFLEHLLKLAPTLHLSDADTCHIKRYLIMAKKMDQKLGLLVDEISQQIKAAGFTAIPTPGMFLDIPTKEDPSTHHINFMNAISGWSPKTEKYYYVCSGVEVGEQIGAIFMEFFTAFLDRYEPDIEVYFTGRDPENPKDFTESMKAWNSEDFHMGIHCLTFETETQSHTDKP